MPEPNRAVIDRVDWKSVLPVLRLVSAFKHALQPGKLLVALVAVLAIHFSGTVLDLIWTNAFNSDSSGVYESLSATLGRLLQQLFASVLAFDLGGGSTSAGVLGSLYGIFIAVPQWMFSEHPWYSLLFGIDVLFVLAMASGILTRMSTSQVCRNQLTPLGSAACFVSGRWVWYLLTPLMPAILIVIVGAVLALAGLVFFNIPGLDIVGALAYGLLVLLGFVVAVVALLLLFALFLMPPALSVEGSDGFDAIARSFNYILFRPWQFAAYLFSSILYLAIVSVLIGTVASLSIDAAGYFVGLGVIIDADPTEAASWIMTRWLELVTAVVAAILFSTFCCLQTQVYVLMRRSADGTPIDQCDGGDDAKPWADTPAAAPMESTESKDRPDDTAKAEG